MTWRTFSNDVDSFRAADSMHAPTIPLLLLLVGEPRQHIWAAGKLRGHSPPVVAFNR